MPEPMPDKGLAHWHFRLPGTGWLARVPKQSQMDLPAEANLAYQSACFVRAAPSGHTPKLLGVLSPSAHLPRGALLVEEIVGRPARLPADLPAIMEALAAIHALPCHRQMVAHRCWTLPTHCRPCSAKSTRRPRTSMRPASRLPAGPGSTPCAHACVPAPRSPAQRPGN